MSDAAPAAVAQSSIRAGSSPAAPSSSFSPTGRPREARRASTSARGHSPSPVVLRPVEPLGEAVAGGGDCQGCDPQCPGVGGVSGGRRPPFLFGFNFRKPDPI